jgi:hypothetical protein
MISNICLNNNIFINNDICYSYDISSLNIYNESWLYNLFTYFKKNNKKDIFISDIILPGTHDSATAGLYYNKITGNNNLDINTTFKGLKIIKNILTWKYFPKCIKKLIYDDLIDFTKTQKNINDNNFLINKNDNDNVLTLQALKGIRYFDLRVYIKNIGIYDNILYHHGSIVWESSILNSIKHLMNNFVILHPNEFLILHFSHFKGDFSKETGVIIDFFKEIEIIFGNKLIYREDNVMSNTYNNQIIQKGRNILIILDHNRNIINDDIAKRYNYIHKANDILIDTYEPKVQRSFEKMKKYVYKVIEKWNKDENSFKNKFGKLQLHYQYSTTLKGIISYLFPRKNIKDTHSAIIEHLIEEGELKGIEFDVANSNLNTRVIRDILNNYWNVNKINIASFDYYYDYSDFILNNIIDINKNRFMNMN